jgi:hypothetical protein
VDPLEWLARMSDHIPDYRGTYKLPAAQTEYENVAHNGSIVPVPGRDQGRGPGRVLVHVLVHVLVLRPASSTFWPTR